MVQTRGKNNRKFKFFIAAFTFKRFFRPFPIFLSSLMSKKSTGMRKSQVGVVFHHFWLFGQYRAIQITVCWAPWCYLLVWLTQFFFFYRLPQPGEVDRLFWVTYYFRILLLFIIMNLLLTTKSIKLEMELLWHQRQSKHLKTYSNVITLI